MMRRCTFTLLVLLSLDLCHPFMGAAFRFEADESIEVVGEGSRVRPAVVMAMPAVPVAPVPSHLVNRPMWARTTARPGPDRVQWIGLRRGAVPLDSLGSLEEDH
jgi:hypothetical protein